MFNVVATTMVVVVVVVVVGRMVVVVRRIMMMMMMILFLLDETMIVAVMLMLMQMNVCQCRRHGGVAYVLAVLGVFGLSSQQNNDGNVDESTKAVDDQVVDSCAPFLLLIVM